MEYSRPSTTQSWYDTKSVISLQAKAENAVGKAESRFENEIVVSNTSARHETIGKLNGSWETSVNEPPLVDYRSLNGSKENLGTPTPETSFQPIESSQFLPEYTIDHFLKAKPGQKGHFCIFRESSTNMAIGHRFEATWWGSLIYHGPFVEDWEEFTENWKQKSTFRTLGDPPTRTHKFLIISTNSPDMTFPFIKIQNFRKESFAAPTAFDWSFTSRTFFGSSQNRKTLNDMVKRNGFEGSWGRMFNNIGYGVRVQPSENPTILLYINFPRLIGYIVAMELCEPGDISKYIAKDDPEAFISTTYFKDGSPSNTNKQVYPSIKLRIPVGEWEEKGWQYTELEGMDVLVS